MGDKEKYSLNWNKFEASATETLKALHSDQNFTNVTLACEDDQQLEAHKVILSAASPFFQRILVKNPHQHPLIYLRGLKMAELKAILNFIYLGQTEVEEENLRSFLQVAEDLEVRGLKTASNDDDKTDEVEKAHENESKVEEENNKASHKCGLCDFQTMSGMGWANEMKEHIRRVHAYSSEEEETGGAAPVKFEEDSNSYMGLVPSHFMDQIDDNAGQDAVPQKQYPCDECDYTATRTDHLRRHKKRKHSNRRIIPIGDFRPGGASRLTEEDTTQNDCFDIKIEEPIQDGSAATTVPEASGREPEDKKHKYGNFSCDQCDFSAKRADYLKRHIDTQHNINRETYHCGECGATFLKRYNLELHKKTKVHYNL
jgi:hypothetical protein